MYFPLSEAIPKDTSSTITKAGNVIEERKASGKLPLGLTEKYDTQLAALKDDSLPDLDIAVFPTTICMFSSSWSLE